jgi:hypothetical protein
MDQLKDILKQAIRHRFWIAVGISAILPIVAYYMGAGAIQQKAQAETASIKAADTDVRQYGSGVVPNAQYKPVVEEKKTELVKDINASWKKLYERQAPLLTWPKAVEERFRTWERKWPEGVDPGAVQLAIIEYVTAYRGFVNEIYQTFHPFDLDPASPTAGVVSAPTEDVLLKPFQFSIETPPELGKVWAAQERLWTQRTLLEVVAQVNHSAKDWNTAAIKQINVLEVGNAASQDQRSMAKAETLSEAPPITDPALPPPAAPTDPNAPAAGQPTQQNADSVYYIKSDSTQFKILPFQISVLIEQDRMQDLLVALENSPMAIQVMEFEMSKPSTRVVKPVKGQMTNFGSYTGENFQQINRTSTYMPSPMISSGMPRPGAPGGRVGIDRRAIDRAAKRKMEEEAAKGGATHTIHDPYFNIVEISVYGQARFYNPPPPEPAPEPSVAAAPEGTPPAGAAEAPKAEAEAEAPKEGAAPAATPNGEAPKAEAPKDAAPAPNGEPPKAEAPKEAAPAPAPNGEPPKAEAPK